MPAAYAAPHFLPAGDTALVVELGDAIDEQVNNRVMALDALVARAGIPGVEETVPTYRSLLVIYEPWTIDRAELVRHLSALLDAMPAVVQAPAGRRWTLPVVYGGAFGEDISFVAASHGLSQAGVIEHHARAEYRVYMIGFQPGFAYLGGLDPVLHTPRRADPRSKVPAGSIAIGGVQTAVYSVEAPSGWHLLGRTPVRVFDLQRAEPFLLAPGDQVRFRPVPAEAWDTLVRRAENGEIVAEVEALP
ncbi:MAG: 5-oxoprolinase subunit PxpB [Chloroflexota bacterium]|nr:5-oxoprolinase subunit PxpB [Chloroflexota bacterium]